jgi:hypothetical protein
VRLAVCFDGLIDVENLGDRSLRNVGRLLSVISQKTVLFTVMAVTSDPAYYTGGDFDKAPVMSVEV